MIRHIFYSQPSPLRRVQILLWCIILVCSPIANAAERLYYDRPSVTPELAKPGRFDVGVSTITVVNPRQRQAVDFTSSADRKLDLEVWYPAQPNDGSQRAVYRNVTRSHQTFELQGAGYRDAAPVLEAARFPLVILSHGYTGYRTIMFYLGEHLASHGYVVAAIDHADSTNAEIDMAQSPYAGFLSTLFNRARDQQFVLDYLAGKGRGNWPMVDPDRAALIGYSMGGYGAINTVGGCYDFSSPALQQFGLPETSVPELLPLFNICAAGREQVDRRWKAMVAFAPWGGEQSVHSAQSLQRIEVPTLLVAGELDDISGFEHGVRKLFEQMASAATHLLVYENARHNIAAHPAPKVAYASDLDIGHHYEPAWEIETINRINQHMTLAFLDCHVKGQAKACDYLPQRESITQTRQADRSLTPPWPGFPDRWGVGLRFYRKANTRPE